MKAIVVTDQAAGTAGVKLVERPEPQADPSPQSPSSVTSLCRVLACKVAAPPFVTGKANAARISARRRSSTAVKRAVNRFRPGVCLGASAMLLIPDDDPRGHQARPADRESWRSVARRWWFSSTTAEPSDCYRERRAPHDPGSRLCPILRRVAEARHAGRSEHPAPRRARRAQCRAGWRRRRCRPRPSRAGGRHMS